MTSIIPATGDLLRVSDLVPLRRMLGQDSIVLRVNPDNSFAISHALPTMFLDPPMRQSLDGFDAPAGGRFDAACREAIESRSSVSLRPDISSGDEIFINPIFDNDGHKVCFLVCWTRHGAGPDAARSGRSWTGLEVGSVQARYRLRSDERSEVVEAAPWWFLANGELVELWPHHAQVSAMGLGHSIIETLIMDAAEAAAEYAGGPAVRIEVPSADMLSGLVPVVHGTLRASGLSPERLLMAIDVNLAVDADLLPIIVHLRTMDVRIDIVGLDALTATLQMVSDTSRHSAAPVPVQQIDHDPWVADFASAIHAAAA